jgi:hypothetical protein
MMVEGARAMGKSRFQASFTFGEDDDQPDISFP